MSRFGALSRVDSCWFMLIRLIGIHMYWLDCLKTWSRTFYLMGSWAQMSLLDSELYLTYFTSVWGVESTVCSWPFLRLRVALWKPLATWWSLCWRHFIRHESEISRLVNLEKHLQRQVWSFLINVSLSNPLTPLVPFDQHSKRQRICTLRARQDLSAAKVLSACATCVLCIRMRLGECVCEPSTPHTNRR